MNADNNVIKIKIIAASEKNSFDRLVLLVFNFVDFILVDFILVKFNC